MPMRRAGLTALALVFVLSGCGGGGGKPLTKEGYASKADAICGKYNEQANAFANPKTLSDLANVADKTLPLLDQAIKDLARLQPAASEKARSDEWLAQVRNLKSDLQKIRDKAKVGDMKAVQAVVPKARDDNTQSNQLATQLGMTVCNKD
jgi:hypothetical protein